MCDRTSDAQRPACCDAAILFLGKQNDACCDAALGFAQKNFRHVTHYLGKWGDPLPGDIDRWEGEYIVSYLSRWVLPEHLLKKAKKAAVNFHPASPAYPGIGCNNFALYEDAAEYGVTCHHMDRRVDSGNIIAVRRFPVFPSDDVASLLSRTYTVQLALFYEIIGKIIKGEDLPVSTEMWERAPFSRKEFNKLFNISHEMDITEVKRRIRATDYVNFKPAVHIGDFVFELKTTPDAD
jgi:methionyl-tRNA formyltransferase